MPFKERICRNTDAVEGFEGPVFEVEANRMLGKDFRENLPGAKAKPCKNDAERDDAKEPESRAFSDVQA